MDPHDWIPRIVLAQTNILEGADVSFGGELMSQLGQKATSDRWCGMSVLPPGADMPVTGRFAPEAALGGLEIQFPLYPRKLTQLRNRGMSEMCHFRTHASQQIAPSFGWLNACAERVQLVQLVQ